MTKQIDPLFAKAMSDLAAKYWKNEIEGAKKLFEMKAPDTSQWKYEDKRQQADLDFIIKCDSAKSRKLNLIRQMALLMVEDYNNADSKSQTSALIDLLNYAQDRISNDGKTKK